MPKPSLVRKREIFMRKLTYIFLALFLVSAILNLYFIFFTKKQNLIPLFNDQFRFLSPSLNKLPVDSNAENSKMILHFAPLREKFEKELLTTLYSGQKIGIYVQDVRSGSWLGINEKEGFAPASLLKLPIALAVYKSVEQGDVSLDQMVEIKVEDIDEAAGVPDRFKVGDQVSVRELLSLMLGVSDNTAKNMLKKLLSPEDLNKVFTHVNITNPYTADAEINYLTTPRQYSRLFKALYYSSYLQPVNSQAILDLLTDTRVESLLSEKLPWEVQIAHKYGERQDALHDCGVIYHSVNPYFICVMTSNVDLLKAKNVMSQVSLDIYNFVEENSKHE
jgi:beta-lactamase class A